MTNDEIKAILATFEYSDQWVEYGFLDEEFLREQNDDFETSDNTNTEHYRYEAFRAYLAYHPVLDSNQLSNFVDLAARDKDQPMGAAALGMLLQWPGLTTDQFEYLSAHPAFAEPFLQKMATRIRLLAEMRHEPLDDASFARYVASGDEAVQRALLERPDLSREQLEILQNQGRNAPIRNIAGAKLRSLTQ